MGMSVLINCDEDGECVLVCPVCHTADEIYEESGAVRSNSLAVETNETVGVRRIIGWLGDVGDPRVRIRCEHCGNTDLELPLKVSEYR